MCVPDMVVLESTFVKYTDVNLRLIVINHFGGYEDMAQHTFEGSSA